MALTACGECGNQVSDKAVACPKCGAPVAERRDTAHSAAASAPAGLQAQSPATAKKRFFTAGRVIAWLFILLAGGLLLLRVGSGTRLAAAIAGPRTIVDERIELKEGEAQSYGFRLQDPEDVDVQVNAAPKKVNMMLMSEEQWAKYKKVHGSLWGGEFEYKKALSREGVLEWTGSELLPPGSWRVVVERPKESLLFGDSTAARVKVVVH